jgi:hypothetical protein
MRSFRHIVLALAASAALGLSPSEGAAQQPAVAWQDSWFWGVYGGVTSFTTTIARTNNAPTIGVDWMITRERFALNVFAEQSYFNAVSTIQDPSTSALRRVNITDMRRVGFAGMFFTPEYRMLKPYFNVGFALNFIKTGTPEGGFYRDSTARNAVLTRIEDARTNGKLFASFGVMTLLRGRYAPFAQYTVMPTKGSGNWMLNGEGFANVFSLGLRYNFGSSIQKKW